MAYNVSEKFRERIYSGGALNRATLTINDVVIPNSDIKKITISEPIIDNTNEGFYLGTFIANKLEIEFKNNVNINFNELDSNVLNLKIGTKVEEPDPVEGTDGYEDVPIGTFLIATSPEDYYKNSKLTCYDKSILFKEKVNIEQWLRKTILKRVGYETYIFDIDFLNTNFSNYVLFFEASSTQQEVDEAIASSDYEDNGYIGNLSIINGNQGENTYYVKVARGSVLQQNYANVINNYDPTDLVSSNDYVVVTTQDANQTPLTCAVLGNFSTLESIGYLLLPSLSTSNNSVDTSVFSSPRRDKLRICVHLGNNPQFEEQIVPITAENLFKNLCKKFLGNNMFGTYPNTNKNVSIATFDSEITGKQYVGWIAEIMGGNAKIGRDGKLNIIPLNQEPAVTIDGLKSESWEIGEKFKVGKIYYEDGTRVASKGGNEYNTIQIRLDNPFMLTDFYSDVVDNLYTELNGFEIYSVKNKNYGDPSLDCWDILQFSLGETNYTTYNNCTLTYEMNISTEINYQIPTKQISTVTENVSAENRRAHNMKVEIDQINGSITQLFEEYDTLNQNVTENDQWYRNQITEIKNDINGTTVNISKTGGTNWLMNTAPYRVLSLNKLENWNGNIYYQIENDSASGYGLLLKNGEVYQSIETMPNGVYSLAFNYKQLSNLANATVSYNGKSFELDPTKDEISTTGEITNGEFTITFNCDVDDGFEIYNLRLVSGNIATAWSQNQNELRTKSVNIGDGITIDSDQSILKNNIDINGMVIINKNTNKEMLVVNNERVETNKFTSKDISNIDGMLVQKIGQQVFITSIIE